MMITAIELPMEKIAEFCDRWQVTEFALFGSVLHDDFRPDSDIDILITFSPNAKRGLTETLQMRDELQTIFDRKVDLIVKTAIERSENWLRRKNILESAQTILLQSLVETDYKKCQRFRVHRGTILSGVELPMSVDSYVALTRLGRHLELFEEIFAQFDAGANPMCCITPIVDGKPKIDITTDHSPLILSKHQGHLKTGEGVMSDYLEDYMTIDGFNLPALINDDYFSAIKVLFNHKHYVSCMKLVVSFIDTMAFLEYGDTRGNFISWLKEFADLARLKITASQLWELRNSILHMSNLDSRKVLTGKEKRIGLFQMLDRQRYASRNIALDRTGGSVCF